MKKRFLSMAVLAQLFSVGHSAEKQPNIIFILCDDMGYGDLGCYGQRYIYTPNIDRMASEGMRFTQAYAGSPVSAPSRASIMTGQHTGHTLVRGNNEYWRDTRTARYGNNLDYAVVGQEPYDSEHVILPEVMKQAGYTTGMFGKWAGGYEGSSSTPDKRGVDEYFGYLCQFQAHAYYPNFLHRYSPRRGDTEVHRITLEENIAYGMPGSADYLQRPQYSAEMIHKEALQWLDQQSADKPFYGFFTYTLPHAELTQPEDSIVQNYRKMFYDDKKWDGQPWSYYHQVEDCHTQFAGMITRLDCYVGEILAKLKEKGFDDNTIVIFSSDNGPHEEGGADPVFFGRDGKLQGIKRSCHEGGIRIPFIVRWPGHVAAGTENHHICAFYDILPTFMDLAGVGSRFPEGIKRGAADCFDGISFAPTLLGRDAEQVSHPYLYWEFHETKQAAVRQGKYKLILKDGKYHLYDLDADIHEDTDLAAKYPEKVEELKGIIKREHITPRIEAFRFPIPGVDE